ncbi:hypothetical protein GCM10010992_27150 [Cloacibacterium rupense]|uniref:Por secretion system C-terminal sorting domain-containing protein n=1 Tax=Cloacibacterium rupense TaxID=517423 RepID=A0ABQ2NLQ9_9FLAO|nr:hypothetical protein GCM10010992_27150 [Cloacibacterium rupense]
MAQTTITQTITRTGPGTFIVPCDVTSITVEAWGAGGGGQGANRNSSGSGGTGGGYMRYVVPVLGGEVFQYTVGVGGTGGGDGGLSEFKSSLTPTTKVLTAIGGKGGGLTITGYGSGVSAPSGNSITWTGSTLQANTKGGNGGKASANYSGGGGASGGDVNGANAYSNPITETAQNMGGAASTNSFAGANGVNNTNNGVSGNIGAGGSGGKRGNNNGTNQGGNGGNGQIRITYTTKYCGKSFTSNVEPITNVTFAGINNTTSGTINGSLSNEYFCSPTASVQQGEVYTVSLSGNTNGNNSNNFRVYVDWDQNGVFGNNADEIYDIGTINNSTSGTTTGSITVPAGATLGTTTMRVVKNRSSYSDACTNASNGQTEDYQVVVSAPTCTAAGGTAALSITTGNPNTPFTASVSGSSNNTAAYDFQWEKSPDNTNWSPIAGQTSPTASITAEPIETTYYYRRKITCKSSGIVTYSSSVSFTTVINYCTPVFKASNIGKLYISSFKFIGVLNDTFLFPPNPNNANISTQTGTNGDYENYTSLVPVAEQAQGSVVNVEAVCGGNIRSPLAAAGRWVAWVDWNRDGTFTASEVVYRVPSPYLTDAVTFGFPIPTNQTPGLYRLRLAVIQGTSPDTSDACNQSAYNGEMEDYLFRVIEDNLAKLDTNQSNIFNRCDPGVVPMTAVGKDANTVNYKWYDAKYGGNLLYTGATYSPTVSSTTTFYVTAVDNTGKETPFRYPFVARIDPIPEVTFTPTPSTICGEDDPYLILSVWGDKRQEILMEEKFDNGIGVATTGEFVNVVEDTFVDSYNTTPYSPDWVMKPTPHTPSNPPHLAIAPSIASGYFGGNFAIINTDVRRNVNVKRHLESKNTYDTTAFLPNSLKLDFDLYYFSIALAEADGYIRVEYSDNGGAWTAFATYVNNQGNPLIWRHLSLDMDALGVPRSANLKIRFSVFSRGDSTKTVSYFESIATVDNVKFYGDKPFGRDFDWSGADNAVLYDKTCTTPLGNTLAREVCVKPPLSEFEKPYWTFNASATFQNGCPATGSTIVYNDTKIWNQPGKTDWNQANDWKPVGVPTIAKCVIARTPIELPTLTSGTHGLARSVINKSGAKITVSPKSSLTIQNYIKNEGAAEDVMVDNDANLIQNNNSAVNIGNITVKRSANLKRLDYNYWGAPVTGQNLRTFSPGTLSNRFYTYNEYNDLFTSIDPNTISFENGKGYAIRASNSLSNVVTSQMHSFIGVPNNGNISVPVLRTASGRGYNLISNPYPSNFDFQAWYNYGINSSIIYNTAYFWTNTNFNPKMQGSSYPSNLPSGTQIINNYAILNGTGGVAAPYAAGTGNNDPIGSPSNCPLCTTPNQYIKVGQGFIVKVRNEGNFNLAFENNSSIRTNNASSIFFNRMSAGKTATETKDRFWISLKTPLDFVSPILIGYVKGATSTYEQDYDAELLVMGGDSFYSLTEDKKLAIQGRYPFSVDDKVSLGTRFGLQGQYEISVDSKEGIFAGQQPIYLKDHLTGVVTNLSQEKYVFTANAGDTTDRFEIQYTNQGTLNTTDLKNQSTVVYQEQNDIIIESPSVIKGVKVFDVSGKLVHQSIEKEKKVTVSSINYSKGVYVIEIVTERGKEVKKIVK